MVRVFSHMVRSKQDTGTNCTVLPALKRLEHARFKVPRHDFSYEALFAMDSETSAICRPRDDVVEAFFFGFLQDAVKLFRKKKALSIGRQLSELFVHDVWGVGFEIL